MCALASATHGTASAVTAAEGLSLLFVADQAPHKERTAGDDDGTDDDGSQILTQPFGHGKVLLSVIVGSKNGG